MKQKRADFSILDSGLRRTKIRIKYLLSNSLSSPSLRRKDTTEGTDKTTDYEIKKRESLQRSFNPTDR